MNNLNVNKTFLGIDGGQSSTKAVIADESGTILGTGFGGSLNHGNLPDGREKLRKAITESVNEALRNASLPLIDEMIFESAHCGMTGGADYKEEIIRQIISAKSLEIGHDALIALYGATAGKQGIIVIAGTGSIVFGVDENGKTARAGGLGYLFADEGGGFWLAVETIKLAIREQDSVIAESGLRKLVLDHFAVSEIRELTNAFYNAQISRDKIAAFAETILETATKNESLKNLVKVGAESLVENVKGAAKQLDFTNEFQVSPIGGMFRNELIQHVFRESLNEKVPGTMLIEPLFNPAIGAVILAYKNAEIEPSEEILSNLKISSARFFRV